MIHALHLDEPLWIAGYLFFGFFLVKSVFYDFPIQWMGSTSLIDYLKNAGVASLAISIIVFISWLLGIASGTFD